MPDPVAIVGMSVLLPGAPDLAAYWRNVAGGVDAITEVPPEKWDSLHYAPDERRADRVYCRRGGFVDELAEVDVTGFGIMPNSVPATEPDQLIALRVAAQAVADAGGPDRLPADRAKVGVVLGRGGYLTPGLVRLDQRVRTASQLVRTLGELLPDLDQSRLDAVRQAFTDQLGPEAPESAIGLVPNLAASRLANRLDLRGPAYTVDAACASSLIAVDHAVRELATGRCDVVLAGGVHHCHDITFWSVFTQLGALSPSERIRPFHRDADGVLIGEGTGIVVLKRLADAERDGDRVYAVITGTGVASDGRTASLANPDSGGQVRAVRQAWAAAGLDPAAPDSIGLLEAHGTATPAGDAAELATLEEVFGSAGAAVLGSVKSMIGHTMPAAGIAGLVKAALAVHHGVLLPTLHCDDPHPMLAKTRFSTLDTARPWDAAVRRAGVNAFGFGGINAHVVLEQAPGRRVSAAVVREPERVLRLAARSVGELRDLLDRPGARGTGDGPVRLGIVDPTEKRLALARKAVARGRSWRGRNDVWFADRPLLGPGGGKLAFVFPGLESELALNCGDVARHFGLPWDHDDVEVGDVGRQGTAVFELGRLLNSALGRMGVTPDAVAGHSLGEWTAMAVAGVHAEAEVDAFLAGFDPDALVVPGLAFAAIGAPAPRVLEELAGRDDVVLSHDNSPNQAMVCGPAAEVGELVTRFRDAGIVAQVLPFKSGFHTPMLRPYLDPIRDAAARFTLHPPTRPIWSATTVSEYPAAEADVRELFVRHLLEPVRFRPLVRAMHAAGFRAFVQVGAGQLGSLVGDTLHGEDHLVVAAHSAHRPGLAQLRRVATALWADGADIDFTRLPGDRPAPHRAVKLDLGGHLISLDDEVRARIALPAGRKSTVDDLAGKGPLAAEFAALLADTAELASTVLSSPARRPAPKQLPAPKELDTTLTVSVEAMPYLLDHCFFKQPPQADPGDRWPVVPATTVIDHLMGFAEQAAPGRRAVAVHDVRLTQWITAVPAVTVGVRVRPLGPSRVLAALDGYSQATVELAPAYPADAPAPWRFPASAEQVPETTAAQLYDERWMFHGPLFQGVTELTAVGERHVRSVLTTPAAPGALLDNVGQVLGYWIMSRLTERTTVFPVGMREIRFHGPHPAPGERLECLVKITALTDEFLDADMQLVHDGQVWAEFTGWRDRRFDSTPHIRQADRTPERSTLSYEQPGGWALVHEQWPDLATRELIMRNYLAGAERDAYDHRPPRGRRQWLLGRIAAKDAVRHLLWAGGESEMFPAELRIGNDDVGRPHATGAYGRELPSLTVSLAHRGEVGVAIARHGRCGIDVEEVGPRAGSTVDAALGAGEQALFAGLTGDPERWFARFWTAKEAVAKLLGTGLRGEPRDFEVIAAAPDALTVRAAGADHAVHCADVDSLPGAPPRRYVVAWTEETKETAE
ncbi:beta-ketoacyl synthase N-terminal-like domain-containing protein [Amycolatopsis mongoliensis]|uniref:Beta-ketoacyl synthase N-terminal-like domain-containing protein n=1 Tax=Amycolatopsis mongoliensis TaxID=715475 RepID=A0A9Y2JLX7_9PSEU|nr:beta-ketoacyl synthase N-terminal-like domain-containing protein [Amycolatopsis sp. 4-36]WIX99696.1 beta-ketoacyl synthase N-terminal-like domain-containing protein [Amycolatopsis sp. 4-36]